jgi:multiple sugar transport system permease protein
MTRRKLFREVSTEAGLLLIGIPVLLWTLIPIYHMFLFAISPKDAAFSGQLWPEHPTLRNFEIVFGQKHHFLYNFWREILYNGGLSRVFTAVGQAIATQVHNSPPQI